MYGLVECDKANGYEVFALLKGCHKLCKMEDSSAIVEVDSFFSYSAGIGKVKVPVGISRLGEEVLHISAQLNCSFHHILQEGNNIVDHLAKEGAST